MVISQKNQNQGFLIEIFACLKKELLRKMLSVQKTDIRFTRKRYGY